MQNVAFVMTHPTTEKQTKYRNLIKDPVLSLERVEFDLNLMRLADYNHQKEQRLYSTHKKTMTVVTVSVSMK